MPNQKAQKCFTSSENGNIVKVLALALSKSWSLRAARLSVPLSLLTTRIGAANFWELEPHRGDSWIWKKLCKLRTLARPFVICEVGSGTTATFWYDNWTALGPLIHLTDERGPAVSGLHKDATVAEALVNGEWWLSASRSRNAIITLLKQCLPPSEPIVISSSDDKLATRDRIRALGLEVPPSCLLCSGCDKFRQHLFFDCVYSSEIWSYFCSRTQVNPPTGFEDCLRWLKTSSTDPNILFIVKLIFQAVVYTIWKERNGRLHSSASRPTQAIIQEVKQTIRLKLDLLSRNMRITSSSSITYSSTWLSIF
ncbi:PREDICTED: uncharacterized protein LOC106297396 [Brassica oleracea var. oleracea]|uniref:uncharacterized protein LOC106297396 n=1 Tax=Brassica oleracea var. oleracea TaxID=109376 RepID=UPI0006A74C67|nr:PREDICTED: uncharacterized protein LOC106297396 [Brassica oleracea var. oleracea]